VRWVPTPSEMDARQAVDRLVDDLAALDRAYSRGHHGRWSASRRASIVDEYLVRVFDAAAPPARVALVALGGYGRGELAPRSDIDLLILHDGARPDEIAALADRLLYPLWDARLDVGHAVRTADEAVVLAAERLDTLTTMLDGRALAGDEALWTTVRGRIGDAVGDVRDLAERLAEEADRRLERHGSVSWLLEPELKEGAGGLRDVAALGWLEAAAGRRLTEEGLLRDSERRAVEAAAEFLVRVRSALHLETGRRLDRLVMDVQPAIAGALGFEDEPDLRAVDALMRNVFEHARHIEHALRSVFDRLLRGSPPEPVDPSPEGVLRAFVAAARGRAVIAPQTLDAVEAVALRDEIEWTDGVRDLFLELVDAGEPSVAMFEAMDRLGILARFLPEWKAVRCRPQRDPYHRYSVDLHLLRTFGGVARALDRDVGDDQMDDPMMAEAVAAIRHRSGVLLGALLHDIGKNGAGRHVPEGDRLAGVALARMRVPDADRSIAHWMVRDHLLLSDTATRRDLGDEDLILDVAAKVETGERLAALYVLTVADAAATGPLAWTPWRSALVRELVAKVQRVLDRGQMGVEVAEQLTERADEIRKALAAEDDALVERFLLRMPRAYLLGVPVERIAEHLGLLTTRVGPTEVRTISGPGERAGTYSLTVVAADRRGLLSSIAGALSLAGLSILSAQVFTTEDDVAVDVFDVEGVFEPQVGEDRWRDFRASLRKALEGRVSLEHLVDQKRRYYPPPRSDLPMEVSLHNDASDFFSVIDVGAADRIGLLFDITRTLAALDLDVHLAKVATYAGRVVDAFYVRDSLGRKLEDPSEIAEIEHALRERLAPTPHEEGGSRSPLA
jgi:[protein-PII] uridylyltransferase